MVDPKTFKLIETEVRRYSEAHDLKVNEHLLDTQIRWTLSKQWKMVAALDWRRQLDAEIARIAISSDPDDPQNWVTMEILEKELAET